MSARAFPIINVRDLPATRGFYEQLGFSQTYEFPPDGEPGFVTVRRGSSSIRGKSGLPSAPRSAEGHRPPWGAAGEALPR